MVIVDLGRWSHKDLIIGMEQDLIRGRGTHNAHELSRASFPAPDLVTWSNMQIQYNLTIYAGRVDAPIVITQADVWINSNNRRIFTLPMPQSREFITFPKAMLV